MRIDRGVLISILVGLLLGLLLLSFTHAGDYGIIDTFVLDHVHDGDTIIGDIPGQYPVFGRKISVRILGIDTPELKGKCQQESVMALEATKVVERLTKDAKIILLHTDRDAHFRVDAVVLADGVNVGQELIRLGLAVPYDGKKKRSQDWCKNDR